MTNCLNCETSYKGNFCPECGQKSTVEKITFSFLVNDFVSRFMDIDKGMLFNLQYLTTSPKKTVFNYIHGKRKNVFNPVSYALIATSLNLVIISLFEMHWVDTSKFENFEGELYSNSYEAGKFIGTYIKFFWLLNIVFLSLFSRLFFKTFSFLEHLAINCFIVGHATLLGMLSYTILRFPIVFDPIVFIYIILLSFMIFQKKRREIRNNSCFYFFCIFFLSTFLHYSFHYSIYN